MATFNKQNQIVTGKQINEVSNQWIEVTVTSPNEGELVLVLIRGLFDPSDFKSELATFESSIGFVSFNTGQLVSRVAHWIKMPQLP